MTWAIGENKDWDDLERRFDWVNAMQHVPQDKIHHAEGNVAIHTKMVLEALTQDEAWRRLPEQDKETLWAAALLHDVEKASTTVHEPDGRISSKGHSRKGAQTAGRILYRDIPAPFAVREQVCGLVRHHSLPLWLHDKRDALRVLARVSLEVNTAWLAMLARADVRGRIAADVNGLLQRVQYFETFCREHGCWGRPYPFATGNAMLQFLGARGRLEPPQTEVVLMSGLPGAGKDAFIKKHYDLPVIAPESRRGLEAAKAQARSCLRRQQPFVWNAPNITRQVRSQLLHLFFGYGAYVKVVYVEAPYQLAAARSNRPEAALQKQVNQLEVPARWEAQEVLYITESPEH
ncbi:AAA family ATPase [Chitinophaga sp.]|uniref:AAA family ATPase n=1 Tax=Chitinophaga sp. TaxID=1869181 RepID=UPI0031DBE5BE